jgi:hypothetical protein
MGDPASVQRMMDTVGRLRQELSSSGGDRLPGKLPPAHRAAPGSAGHHDDSATLRTEVQQLKEDVDRRQVGGVACTILRLCRCLTYVAEQAAYIRREREYRARIELLEHQLAEVCCWHFWVCVPVCFNSVAVQARSSRALEEAEDPMKKARDMHKNILGRIDLVQQQTGRILQGVPHARPALLTQLTRVVCAAQSKSGTCFEPSVRDCLMSKLNWRR